MWRIAFRSRSERGSRELTADDVPEAVLSMRAAIPRSQLRSELPPQRRMTIFLRYFADLSYAEIGEVLGSRKERSPRPCPRRTGS